MAGAPRSEAVLPASASASATPASWPVDHGRTVNGSFDGVVGDVREGRPQRTPLAGRRIGVGDGREQGMGRPQARAVGDQDAFLARLIHCPPATVADDALDEGQARGRRHGHDHDASSSVPAQRREVIADDRLNLRWDREGLTQRRFHRSSLERSTDFQAQEGVAGAGLVETDQQRSGVGHAQPLMDEPAKRSHGQGPDIHPLGSFDGRGDEIGSAGLHRLARTGSAGEDEPDWFGPEAAGGEGEGLLAGTIGPLHVIDRNDHRAFGGQDAQDVGHGQPDQARLGSMEARTDSTDGGLEGLPPWIGHAVQERDECRFVEERRQRSEGQLSLGAAGPPRQHPITPFRRPLNRVRPQGAFADAGLATDEQRRRTVRLEPCVDRPAFRVPPDHHCPGRGLCLHPRW